MRTMTQEQMAAHDKRTADLMVQASQARDSIDRVRERMHTLVGDRKDGYGRRGVWGMTLTQVGERMHRLVEMGDARELRSGSKPSVLLHQEDSLVATLAEVQEQIEALDAVYRANGWRRYIECTNADGHVHNSHGCPTLNRGLYATALIWRTTMSGLTPREAVDRLGPTLCSVCFPEAPVEHCRSRGDVERERNAPAKAAEKAARATALAAKRLTTGEGGEAFVTAYSRERVETVAECKNRIRKAVEERVQLEAMIKPGYATEWIGRGGTTEGLANVITSTTQNVVDMDQDAEKAATVLIAREQEHPGWGATAGEIAKIRSSKEKAARREWGLS